MYFWSHCSKVAIFTYKSFAPVKFEYRLSAENSSVQQYCEKPISISYHTAKTMEANDDNDTTLSSKNINLTNEGSGNFTFQPFYSF